MPTNRARTIRDLYGQLTTFARRSRELGQDLHPGMSVVAYTFLTHVASHPEVKAADLAQHFGLDKSTVSRQLDQLTSSGLIERTGGDRPGRRGQVLVLTARGEAALDDAAERIQKQLIEWLESWPLSDIAAFTALMTRFNAAAGESVLDLQP